MMGKIRVLVVDDSAFMRTFISDIISKEPDMLVIDTAGDGDAAISKVKAMNPDVVTLDVEMPGKNGLEVLKEIKNISSASGNHVKRFNDRRFCHNHRSIENRSF